MSDRLEAQALLTRKLRLASDLGETDLTAIRALPLEFKYPKAGEALSLDGERPTRCCMVMNGLVQRSKMTTDGIRRVLSMHHPSDMPDLQSVRMPHTDGVLHAAVPSRIAFIRHVALIDLMEARPRVAAAIWVVAMMDAAIARQWVFVHSALSADQRVAHLICETYLRLETLGLAHKHLFTLALTQASIADIVGLSAVHVNRVLQSLRHRQLIRTKGTSVEILDWPGLQADADFDPSYLHLRPSEVETAARAPFGAML